MKITFINPRTISFTQRYSGQFPSVIKDLINNNPVLKKRLDFTQKAFNALGLLTIAGVVPDDIEIEFIDENWEEINFNNHFDLVALGGNLDQQNRLFELAKLFRNRNIPVVAGGNAVTTFPDLFVAQGIPVIKGEGEILFREFLDDFLHHDSRLIYDNKENPDHIDLKESPVPRFDLAAKYNYSMVGVQISRGCPFNCSFCQVSHIFGNLYRYKTIGQILEEIKRVKGYWPDSFFFFYDDNPFARRKLILDLFSRINDEGIQLGRWGANANVNIYKDKELLAVITSNGILAFLGIGLESLSVDTLDSINNKMKHDHLNEYRRAIKVLKEYRIHPVGYFMFGFKNSRLKDIRDIIDFVLENKIDVQLSRVIPMPGTALYRELKDEYETEFGPLKKMSLGEWGVLRRYLAQKSGLPEQEISGNMNRAYSILFSDENFQSRELIPTLFLI